MRIVYLTITALIAFFIFTSVWAFLSVLFPQEISSEATPADYDLPYKDVQFETTDGLSLAGWLTDSGSSESKAVILAHGYPTDKGDVLPLTAHLGEEYDLLYFDFRGLGESEGSYSSVGIRERRDLRAAVTFLEDHGYEEIGIWGFSAGAATALMEAPRHDSVQAVAAVASYARLSELAEQLFRIPYLDIGLAQLVRGYAYLTFGEDIRDVAPVAAMADYNKPVLIIHSQDDQIIPFEQAQQLEVALSENAAAEFWWPSGGHIYIPVEEHKQQLQDFFGRNL